MSIGALVSGWPPLVLRAAVFCPVLSWITWFPRGLAPPDSWLGAALNFSGFSLSCPVWDVQALVFVLDFVIAQNSEHGIPVANSVAKIPENVLYVTSEAEKVV